MRSVAWVLLATLSIPAAAMAQEPPPPPAQPTPAPYQYTAMPSLSAPPPKPYVSPDTYKRWRRGRILYGVGSFIGLAGTALALSSVLVVAITGYPCNPNDPLNAVSINNKCNPANPRYDTPSPTDTAPLLAYMGSTASALGFVLTSAGLGYQHHLLRELNSDIPRGIFAGGTALGLLGFISTGVSYFFGFTHYLNPHDQGIAILASSITGTGLCLLGGLLYTIDSSRMRRAWQRITTF